MDFTSEIERPVPSFSYTKHKLSTVLGKLCTDFWAVGTRVRKFRFVFDVICIVQRELSTSCPHLVERKLSKIFLGASVVLLV